MKIIGRYLCIALVAITAQPVLTVQTAFAQDSALEEITVTAQRREESLQKAAIAIDVATGQTLVRNGVTSTEDLSRFNPALTVSNGGGASSQLYMRGVGNRTTSAYIDPAIVMSYDGVFMGRASGAATGAYYDLDRVEILKGPQGTLYGRNSTGGVINIIPNDPELGESGGDISLTAGSYGLVNVSGAINVPVSDTSAFRFAGSYVNRDGYNDDGTNDKDNLAFRAQFLTEISDALSIRVGADWMDQGGLGVGTSYRGRYAPGTYAWIPATDDPNFPAGLTPESGMNSAAGNAYRQTLLGAPGFGFLIPIQDEWGADNQFMGVNAEISYDVAAGTFTIIPAWRKVEQDTKFGMPAFNSGWFQETDEQKSLEVRFANNGGEKLDYILGAFYFNETIDGNNTFNQEFVLPTQLFTQDADSWALFAHLTWNLSDTTRLITGVRYTDDSKSFSGGNDTFVTFCGATAPPPTVPPASFGAGCADPGNLPHYPTFDTGGENAAWLISEGWVAADADWAPAPFEPLLNGVGVVARFRNSFTDSYAENETTYRVALEWDVADDSMLYVSYETGYRAGGFQLSPSAAQYKPEYIDAYTIGSKNRFADGRAQLNVELFYWDYQDQQISYFTTNANSELENLTDNVGSTTNQGIDVDLMWQAAENSLLSLKVQYLDATYDELFFRAPPPRDNINCPREIVGATNDGAPVFEFDCSGQTAVFAPEWSVFAGIEQTFPLSSMDVVATLTTRYMSEQVGGFWNLEGENIEAQSITDLDVTLLPHDGDWTLSAYVRNLEDERRVQLTQTSPLGPGMASYGPDMEFGVRFGYNFGQ